MNYILFDDSNRNNLLPLAFTRPISEFRVGIYTIKEKWEKLLDKSISNLTEKYLDKKYPLKTEDINTYINSSILPNKELIEEIEKLSDNQSLIKDNILIAQKGNKFSYPSCKSITFNGSFLKMDNLWDIFSFNGEAINQDFELFLEHRKSEKLSETNNIISPENIFVEKGVKVEFATLNASNGPIYIGRDAEIMENSVVRGPFALCNNSTLKLSSKIYGPTTIGPHSKVGGEINNSVIFGYSNKGHDGFLGNSVIGEWCNIGADSNNSNLKNNYAEVRLWNYSEERFVKTGKQFCGLIMGDHSKCAINSMFNTGTVVGVFANMFGSGFMRNFVPDFSWGGSGGLSIYSKSKAYEVASLVMERRNVEFDEIEENILTKVFELTEKYRKFK
jgi:UDP-N-acetylglucosamine diphosphorylase/glucosamine-1-phosphate N-acetyltransferase